MSQVLLLGPFRARFDDADVASYPGELIAPVGTIPSGSVILHAWAVPRVKCRASLASPVVTVFIGNADAQVFTAFVQSNANDNQQTGDVGWLQSFDNEQPGLTERTFLATAGLGIYAQMVDSEDGTTPLDQGEVDIYALLAAS